MVGPEELRHTCAYCSGRFAQSKMQFFTRNNHLICPTCYDKQPKITVNEDGKLVFPQRFAFQAHLTLRQLKLVAPALTAAGYRWGGAPFDASIGQINTKYPNGAFYIFGEHRQAVTHNGPTPYNPERIPQIRGEDMVNAVFETVRS